MKKIFVAIMMLFVVSITVESQEFYMEAGRVYVAESSSSNISTTKEVQYFDIGLALDMLDCILLETASSSFYTGIGNTTDIGSIALIGIDFTFDIAVYKKFDTTMFTLGYIYTAGSSNTFDTLIIDELSITDEFSSFNTLYIRVDIKF